MDFALPEELQLLQETVRKFVDQELIPVEMECRDGVTLKPEYRERFETKAREMGLWMLDVPEEFGGAGLSLFAQVIIWAEMARSVAVPSRGRSIFGPEVRPVLYALNDEQKERYLYPLLRDEKRACFAQTEPDAGSDPGSMRTRARARRRRIRHQRRQALHHRGGRGRFRPGDGGHGTPARAPTAASPASWWTWTTRA